MKCKTSESEAHEIDSTSSCLFEAGAELLKPFEVLDSLSAHIGHAGIWGYCAMPSEKEALLGTSQTGTIPDSSKQYQYPFSHTLERKPYENFKQIDIKRF